MSLFGKMRERRLFQILVSYAVAGWGVLEVLDQLVDRGILPNVAYKVALIWYLGAFPAVLLVGWFHGEKGKQRPPALEIAALLLLTLTVVGLSGSTVRDFMSQRLVEQARSSQADLKRVAVLYFDDHSPDHDFRFLADGLTESLIEELQQVQALDVVSRNGVGQFRSADVAPDSVARVLHVGTVVDGSVERDGSDVRVTVRLIDAASGAEFRRIGFEHPAGDMLALRDELADRTARMLREWLGEEIRVRREAQDTKDVMAWALVQRAEKARKDANSALKAQDQAAWQANIDQAEKLLAQAAARDPAWAEPVVMEGELEYQRSRVARGDLQRTVTFIDHGLGLAGQAIELAPRYARAYELRGTLQYWRWLLRADPDPATQARLFAGGKADLQHAVELEPGRASAYSVLSHLYANDPTAGPTDIVLAAQKAYQDDAYLEVANDVLYRLFTGSIDLEQFTQAQRWCDEGMHRFPRDDRFALCGIMLMSTPGAPTDPARAWRLLALMDTLMPAQRRSGGNLILGQIYVAAALARAHLPDSARAVLRRADAQITPAVDPAQELLPYESFAWSLLGDRDHALDLLKRWATAAPGRLFKAGERVGWMWRSLQDDPRFRSLVATS